MKIAWKKCEVCEDFHHGTLSLLLMKILSYGQENFNFLSFIGRRYYSYNGV
jgi:hypothetical protein